MTVCHLCPEAATGLYPAGPRCTQHTPAKVAGRPEAPAPTAIAQLEKKLAARERAERTRKR